MLLAKNPNVEEFYVRFSDMCGYFLFDRSDSTPEQQYIHIDELTGLLEMIFPALRLLSQVPNPLFDMT